MFHSARIKLTIWYIVISMSISIFFSIGIYAILHRELIRNERRMNFRIQMMYDEQQLLDPEFMRRRNMIKMTERAMALNLFYINMVILAMSSLAGYFLAGRTLRPIQQIVASQNQFIADASHELRTPLTALRTAIEVNLRDKKLDLKQAKTVLRENLDDVNKLQQLSEHLLALASFKTNVGGQLEQIDLPVIVKKAMQAVSYQAKEKGIVFKTSFENVTLTGDVKRLTEGFIIFLDNAVKYSSKKSTVYVTVKKTDGHAQVVIKDEGIGIAKKDHRQIFERFYRADTSRSKSDAGGYGLGLAIAKKTIDSHGGTIGVDSTAGQGATFTITLPVKP